MKKQKRALIIEANQVSRDTLEASLNHKNYDTVACLNVEDANREVEKSILTGQRFNIAVVGLKIGDDSGAEFARRLIEIIGDINVIIISAVADKELFSLPAYDEVIFYGQNAFETLSLLLKRLNKPIRNKCRGSKSIIVNRWRASGKLRGINSLKYLTQSISEDGRVEKFSSLTSDHLWVTTNCYLSQDGARTKIGLSSLVGCPGRCEFCSNHLHHENENGEPISFVRKLTVKEILAQFYRAILMEKVEASFRDNSKIGLTVNFTCSGDALAWNLENTVQSILQMAKIEHPKLSFVLTSVGSESSLRRFLRLLRKFTVLKDVYHYWSVNSLVKETREKHMPGANQGQDLTKMRDLYQMIAERTDKEVTASWIVIKGVTDRPEDAKTIAEFFNGRPFKLKIMALVDGSLKDAKEVTDDDAEAFKQLCIASGVTIPIRVKPIFGSDIESGCGNCLDPQSARRNRVKILQQM
jgi:adenine C2-methylase RlmN of 23S rRNA A2503 and tRNA A37